MKLLLDEMISPKIARELRSKGADVQAIKGDRPDLEAVADRGIVRRIATEQRTLVTNDVLDFQLIHNQMLAAGEGALWLDLHQRLYDASKQGIDPALGEVPSESL